MTNVNVSFNRKGSEVSIAVDPEPLDLSAVDGTFDIEWVLSGNVPDAEFEAGIQIRGAGSRFGDKGKPDNKHHKWERRGRDSKRYTYRISIVDKTVPSDPTTYELDPTIRN